MAVWEEQGLMGEVSLLERLDAFFGEGANTEAIGNFFSEEYELVQRLDYSNDSAEALELYALFRRYNALVSKILDAFSSREAAAGKPVTLEELAAAVMEEYRQPQDFCRYLCTGYIAGSLDFDSFKQLAADVVSMTTYPVGDEIDEHDDASGSDSSEEDDENGEEAPIGVQFARMETPPRFPSSAGSLLPGLKPLVRVRPYRTRDLKMLMAGAVQLDLAQEIVLLHSVSEELISHLRKSSGETPCSRNWDELLDVKRIKRTDFHRAAAASSSVIAATSLGLWGSVDYCADILNSVRMRFLPHADVTRVNKKVKLQIRHFFKFLNELHIDVVVLSSDRTSAVMYLSTRSGSPSSQTAGQPPQVVANGERRFYDRTLLALEFNHADASWWPLSLTVAYENDNYVASLPKLIPENEKLLSDASAPMPRGRNGVLLHAHQLITDTESVSCTRTAYNPQHTENWKGCNAVQADCGDDRLTSPCAKMRYPNIEPLSLLFFSVILEGLRPTLYRNRMRFIVAVPVAILGFLLGILLIIYLSMNMLPCCHDVSSNQCVGSPSSSSYDAYCDETFCNAKSNTALARVHSAFLFGNSAAPGHFIVGTVCCMFLAVLATVLTAYFTTRSMVMKKSRPLFYLIVMTAHALVAAVATAFSAYAVSFFSLPRHTVGCSSFNDRDAVSCLLAQRFCPNHIMEVVRPNFGPVDLVLCAVLLVLSAVELLVSLIPPIPSRDVVDGLAKAEPETGTFYPSRYAPDGITRRQQEALVQHIRKKLELWLKDQVNDDSVLLKRCASVGEMILLNRQHSLKTKDWHDATVEFSTIHAVV